MLASLLLYCVLGAVAGFLAGLLGIGGGAVIVPMLVFSFGWQGISPDVAMHMAIGTSLGSIIFTAFSSAMAHHKKGGVDWSVFIKITPGILAGTYLGSFIASQVPGKWLQLFFFAFLFYVAANMLRNKKTDPERTLPGIAGMTCAGLGIGGVSSLVGIGGGTLSVPFLVRHNVDMRRAVGTSSSIGIAIAVAGCLGYVTNGWGTEALPRYALGYLYLPALAGIVAVSTLTAPMGASVAHRLPVPKLKKIFGCFLFVVGAKMLADAIRSIAA